MKGSDSLVSSRMLGNPCQMKKIQPTSFFSKRNEVFMNTYLTIIEVGLILHFELLIKS